MKVLFAAGGTGGHINPALSAAQELKSRYPDAGILFVGTKEKMESTLVPKSGFDFASINISGFYRSFSPQSIVHNAKTLKKLVFVTAQCKKIINEFKPDVVVGFGGYVSGPVVRTAHKMGIKTAIHEQNAFPGKTNIALARYADAVMLTSERAADKMKSKSESVVTGLPVRAELLCADKAAARKNLRIPDNIPVVLSTGGSLGAESINSAMCSVIPKFINRDICFIFGYGQLGRDTPEKLKAEGITELNSEKLRVSEYIYGMADAMAAADLVISRAGASSLAEIEAMGKASVLVPSPYVTENHQYHNAMSLVEKNAALMIEQKDLTGEKLSAIIEDLLENPGRFSSIGQNARNIALIDAKKRICDIIVSLAE
ncbi:MAG: undecaprenyldiphospho-muramoylpentapeptide beta-N-acetylglucosaminyltransferase [Oscillospiraceae bacterium]|nr:undecaprenyldiphospho-muramoylpentapeptide beta-N-acetylglucosaminyltransferase [Oscillospiraceae bacterium]